MPTIYDNIDNPLIDGLRSMLSGARSADFCVGYFNLRGWGGIATDVEKLPNGCRLLIGMSAMPEKIVRSIYNSTDDGFDGELTQGEVVKAKTAAIEHFIEQLAYGYPTAEHNRQLKMLARQLREKKVTVKFHGRYVLHAKLYLAHRQDAVAALAGVVGSSNLTFAGLKRNGELNIDVLDQDAAQKLSAWFDVRWEDKWSMDVSEELADIIEKSWVTSRPPYHIYLKTAWHLSQDAVTGAKEYPLPRLFRSKMLKFQARGVELAAALLAKQRGVIIGDVVGLGKTIVASAVVKTFQERDRDSRVLIICPPKLKNMWEEYLQEYSIAGKILSNSSITLSKLSDLRRYKLLIVDESHNFRNRDSKRFGFLRDYISTNHSRVILLTATPYNMAYTDIASQLRLFINPDRDLGVRPDNYIKNIGGVTQFKAKHQNMSPSSLAAFEQSGQVDDWRELMRMFMVRRTRAHIKEHYATYDKEKKRHYLPYSKDKRFYFPERVPRRLSFSLVSSDGEEDDYAKLYSPQVVDIIGDLMLPRYGLASYLLKDTTSIKNQEDKKIISNLVRAGSGTQLLGFTRSGLFKRLESGGEAFLLSIGRHILRNNIYLAALDDGNELPIGQVHFADSEDTAEYLEDEEFVVDGVDFSAPRAKKIYAEMQGILRHKYDWISCDYFDKARLLKELQKDNALLEKIRARVPQWQAAKDRKLRALFDLVQTTHSTEKVLVFSQYKDTVSYLYRELEKMGVKKIDSAHGGKKDIRHIVGRFSPRSNEQKPGSAELRILIATDALSEGQNLQDAHIVVNYDLPWALIRLVQRAGRVDRIGQESSNIYCYSAMPEEGIEKIIDLRKRLRVRMEQNAELIGSDEQFFEGDKEEVGQMQLRGLYAGTTNLEEPEGETDLVSLAYDIWRRAIKEDPELATIIPDLPKVVNSAKATKSGAGVIAYIRNRHGHDILTHIDKKGEIVSQAQAHILEMLECTAKTASVAIAKNHHDLVISGIQELEKNAAQTIGGQLGSKKAVRRQLYDWLENMIKSTEQGPLFSNSEKTQLKQALQDVHDRPLAETARGTFLQLFKEGADDEELHKTLVHFIEYRKLCFDAADDENRESHIICSMGLSND